MSISHKKINSMIENVVEDSELFTEKKNEFIELCQRVYLIESTASSSTSNRQLISDIKEEIERRSKTFTKEG